MRRLQWMVVVKGELDHSLVLGSFASLWVFLELGRDLNCDEKFGRTLFFFLSCVCHETEGFSFGTPCLSYLFVCQLLKVLTVHVNLYLTHLSDGLYVRVTRYVHLL